MTHRRTCLLRLVASVTLVAIGWQQTDSRLLGAGVQVGQDGSRASTEGAANSEATPDADEDEVREEAQQELAPLGGLLEGLDLGPAGDDEVVGPGVAEPGMDGTGAEKMTQQAAQEDESVSEVSLFLDAYRSMVEARDLLAAGNLAEPTLAAQQRAIDKLDALLKRSQSQDESSDPSGAQGNASQQDQSQPDDAKQPEDSATGESNEPRDASQEDKQAGQSESSESNEEGNQESPGSDETTSLDEDSQAGNDSGNVDMQQRLERGEMARAGGRQSLEANEQAIWGHLPKRTRGLLRAEIPTEFLPEYASEISAYFRALAEMPIDE